MNICDFLIFSLLQSEFLLQSSYSSLRLNKSILFYVHFYNSFRATNLSNLSCSWNKDKTIRCTSMHEVITSDMAASEAWSCSSRPEIRRWHCIITKKRSYKSHWSHLSKNALFTSDKLLCKAAFFLFEASSDFVKVSFWHCACSLLSFCIQKTSYEYKVKIIVKKVCT